MKKLMKSIPVFITLMAVYSIPLMADVIDDREMEGIPAESMGFSTILVIGVVIVTLILLTRKKRGK